MNEAKNTLQQIQPRWHRRFLRAAGAPACGLVLLGAMGGCGRYTHPRKHVDLPPEQLEARLSKGARWLYYHIDVTDDQRLKIDALFKELTPEVTRLQKERKTLLDQFIQALEADQVSAEGLAMLKANGLKLTEDRWMAV